MRHTKPLPGSRCRSRVQCAVSLNHARLLPPANAARFAQAYNEAADRLALVPATAKRAEGAAFEARLDRSGATAADMVTADLKVPSACAVLSV